MAHRLGMGTELDIDIPGQRIGLVPTKDWRQSKGHPWELGDTVVSGIGQGYIVVSPLQLATYAARIATGRAVNLISRAGSPAPCNPVPCPKTGRTSPPGPDAASREIRYVRRGK